MAQNEEGGDQKQIENLPVQQCPERDIKKSGACFW
jgi:hypothetical protein